MEKIKIKFIMIIIMILGILCIGNISQAKLLDNDKLDQLKNANVGDQIRLWGTNYSIGSTPNLYCLQHGLKFADPLRIQYTVKHIIEIDAKTSTDAKGRTATSKLNAKMVGIVGSYQGQNAKQNSFWNNIYNWMQKIGNPYHKIPLNFVYNTPGGKESVTQEATNYADSVQEIGVTDTTEQDSIKTVLVTRDNVRYARVGPLKVKYTSDLTNVDVYNQNNTVVNNIRFGSSKVFYSSFAEIKNNKNFYVYVPVNSGITKITKVKVTTKGEVKSARLVFMKSQYDGVYQNLLMAFPKTKTEKVSVTIPVNEEIPPDTATGVLKLIQSTDEPLPKITFGLKYWIPDNKEYMVYNKRRPQTSDSEFWDTIHVSCSHPVYGKDDEGKEIITGYKHAYDTSSEYNGARYQAALAVWLDWQAGNEYYDKSKHQYVETGTSDKNGNVTFTGRWDGTYSIYEISSGNPYFDVSSSSPIKSGYRLGNKVTLENRRTYVDIEGIVFIDEQPLGTKAEANGLYDKGEEVNHVKVSLKKNGTTVAELYSGTDSKGKTLTEGRYKFWGDRNNLKIKMDELNQYLIEFEYNGMLYKSVEPAKLSEENGSKASDLQAPRNALNEKYKKITSTTPNDITYEQPEETPYVSYVEYTDEQKANSTGIEAYKHEQYGRDQYHIQATTQQAGLNLYNYYMNTAGQAENSIENVNFGIIDREQPDLAVKKDIDNVSVVINGYEQVYKYGDRFKDDTEEGYIEEELKKLDYPYYNVGVKFESDYAKMSYSRNLYESDIMYEGDKKLEVKVCYKVALKNKATSLLSSVEQLNDYFSSYYSNNLADIKVGQINQTTGQITEYTDSNLVEILNSEDPGYHKIKINHKFDISREKTEQFYIQLTINRDALKQMAVQQKEITLDNFIEIEAYSTKDQNGKDYAGIDKNSRPGNMRPNQISTYEDDMDKAPGLDVGLKEERQIVGNVFEDIPVYDTPLEHTEKQLGYERKGNGIFDTGETLVKAKKVELYNVDAEGNPTTVAKIYKKGSGFIDAVFNDVDTYNIAGYIPGKYLIKYTWGDGTHTVQKYKGTIYNQPERQNNQYWYLVSTPRNSDAMDDYELRKTIDEETKEMTNKNLKGLTNDTMISSTPKMNMELEYGIISSLIDYEDEKAQYELDANGQVVYQNGQVKTKNSIALYKAENVDFGIVERARQELELEKKIKQATLVGTDGTLLINVKMDENGKPMEGQEIKNVTYIEPSGVNPKGKLKAEIDEEIIQSATLIIQYEYTVSNVSEVDYANKDYYLYGTNQKASDLIYLNPSKIIDYVDNAVEKYSDKTDKERYDDNDNWILKETKAEKEELINNGWISEELKEQLLSSDKIAIRDNFIEGDGLIPIVGKDAVFVEGKNKEKTRFAISKLLADMQEEINIGNYAEIIITNRNSKDNLGTILDKSTPGNYEISATKYTIVEPDSSFSDEFTIIKPTGENRNFIVYIVIGVTSLVILATGVILIKKKVI